MITAEEARKISKESGENIDLSKVLNELDGRIRKAATKGVTSIYVLKTNDEIAEECGVSLEKLPVAIRKIENAMNSFGYEAKVVGPLAPAPESTCRYQINISWKMADSKQTKHLDSGIEAFFSRFWNNGPVNKSSES